MSARRLAQGDTLLIASHNEGKVGEIRALLAPFGVATVSLNERGLPAPDETEATFEGNARLKSDAAARATGLPALADDSGLEIDALDGAPGVHTADWAETPTGRDFALAMRKAHDALADRGAAEPWMARFVCVLSLTWPDGAHVAYRGVAAGRVVWPPRGAQGHGYDPMFVLDGETRTFGETPPDEKNAVSHRADAFAQLVREAMPALL